MGGPLLDGADPWLILALTALFAVAAMGCAGGGPVLGGPCAGAAPWGKGGCPLPLPEKDFFL